MADAIKAQTGIEVDKKKIVMEPVKALGDYQVVLKLHKDVQAEVTIGVEEA